MALGMALCTCRILSDRSRMEQSVRGDGFDQVKMGDFGGNRVLRGTSRVENGRNRRETFVRFRKVRRTLEPYGKTGPWQ
jgi:hypothetical protein